MNKRLIYFVSFFLMFFGIIMNSNAQSVNDLQSQINKLQNDIKVTQNLLNKTSKDKRMTTEKIELLQTQINKRDKLIKTYNSQIKALNNDIASSKNDIKKLQENLKKSRNEYARLLVIINRNRNNINNLLFVFSSNDFNQAVRRTRYIKQFNELLKSKMKDIEVNKAEIEVAIGKSESDKKQIENLLAVQKKEKAELEKDKTKLKDDIATFNKTEKNLKNEINKKKKESDALQKKVKELIAKELEARKANSEIDTKLSTNFSNNKGKLPWPVANGVVTKKYGDIPHPTQPKVKVKNNGIDISTDKGAEALCVFNGEVTNVFNTGSTNVVLVRHGLYFTLYANLDKVYVKGGDSVKTGQKLGLIHTGANDNVTTLHFELWYDKNHTNPEAWLK